MGFAQQNHPGNKRVMGYWKDLISRGWTSDEAEHALPSHPKLRVVSKRSALFKRLWFVNGKAREKGSTCKTGDFSPLAYVSN